MNQLNVSKWGGASNSCRHQIDRCARVLPEDCRVLVVSAPGTCSGHLIKVTDLLIRSINHHDLIDQVIARFIALMVELEVDLPDLVHEMHDVAQRLRAGEIMRSEYLASRGEAWTAPIIATYLGGPWQAIDSAEVFRFTTDGQLDIELTLALIRERCSEGGHYVLGGFFGADENGVVYTGPRGASDYWAALAALALDAAACTFWKDVPGVFDKNPKEADDAQLITHLTNDAFAADFVDADGNGVLHRRAALLLAGEIDIHVASFLTGETGTVINTSCAIRRRAA